MFLHALESLFKLRDQWSLSGLKTVASHDAPEKIAVRSLVGIVDGQQIFRRTPRDKNNDVGFRGLIHERQFAPRLNGILHSTNRLPIFGKQVWIELISVVRSNIHIPCIRQTARKRRRFRGRGTGRGQGRNHGDRNQAIAEKENRFICSFVG